MGFPLPYYPTQVEAQNGLMGYWRAPKPHRTERDTQDTLHELNNRSGLPEPAFMQTLNEVLHLLFKGNIDSLKIRKTCKRTQIKTACDWLKLGTHLTCESMNCSGTKHRIRVQWLFPVFNKIILLFQKTILEMMPARLDWKTSYLLKDCLFFSQEESAPE